MKPKERHESWLRKIGAIIADERADPSTRSVARSTLHRILEVEPMPGWYTFEQNWTSTRPGLWAVQDKHYRFMVRETKDGRFVWILFNRRTRESRRSDPNTTYQTMEGAKEAMWTERAMF